MKNFVIFSNNTVYRETISEMVVDFGLCCLLSESVTSETQVLRKNLSPDIIFIDIYSRGATEEFITLVKDSFKTSKTVFIVSANNPLISYFMKKHNVKDLLFIEDDSVLTRERIGNIISLSGIEHDLYFCKNLTIRECEVLKLIAEGKTSREIADELFISKNTVDTHRNKMLQKLNMSNSASLVTYACKSGLL